jgi:hypothetical protein
MVVTYLSVMLPGQEVARGFNRAHVRAGQEPSGNVRPRKNIENVQRFLDGLSEAKLWSFARRPLDLDWLVRYSSPTRCSAIWR